MDDRIKLAEAYYTTARDLERQGRHYLEMAQALSTIADAICEANMREKSPPDSAFSNETISNRGESK